MKIHDEIFKECYKKGFKYPHVEYHDETKYVQVLVMDTITKNKSNGKMIVALEPTAQQALVFIRENYENKD